MPKLAPDRLPKYRLHKHSGRAIVTLSGRDHLLPGKYGSRQSQAAYDRLIAEWIASGRQPLDRVTTASEDTWTGFTILNLMAAYVHHARSFWPAPDIAVKSTTL